MDDDRCDAECEGSEAREMRQWNEKAPLSVAAFGPLGHDGDQPPPIQAEWGALTPDDQDTILLWAGSVNRGYTRLGWTWLLTHTGGAPDRRGYKGGHPHPILRAPAASIERLLAPLAHESRVRLMQAMYDGPKSSSELSQATGLTGGNLYYHLKELMHAAYVADKDGAYDMTDLGYQLVLTLAGIAHHVVADRGEEGLLVTSR
jgi:DNA-binding transcriptional ArsR family regulator